MEGASCVIEYRIHKSILMPDPKHDPFDLLDGRGDHTEDG
jgi:hypothetical protein